MGPHCPECDTVFTWTAGELEEEVLGPRAYVCAACGALFVLQPEEVAALQVRLRAPKPEPEPEPAPPPRAGEIQETTPIIDLEPDLSGCTDLEAADRALGLGEQLCEIGQRLYEKLAKLSGERVSDEDYARLFDVEQRTWRDAVKKGGQAIARLTAAPDGPEREELRARALELLTLARAHLRPT